MKDYQTINKNNLKSYLDRFGGYKNIEVLFFSIYKLDYTRTETIEQLFKEIGISTIKNTIYKKHYLFRVIYNVYWLLKNIRKCDVVYVHFRGHEILPIVAFISFLFKKKVIFDMFVSMWDTVCFDRQIFKPYSLIGKIIRLYDKILIKMSDFILVDTNTHLTYFIHQLGLSKDKGGFLYVGANQDIFHPISVKKADKFRVFWYGNVLPLQGVDIILKAAKLLENNKNIEFVFVGPIKKVYDILIKQLKPSNIIFIDWIPYKELPKEICKSHLCLGGHFSYINKASRVIAGKTFQFLSCGIPTIVGACKANRELFNKDDRLVKFVEISNYKYLAKLIELFYVKI